MSELLIKWKAIELCPVCGDNKKHFFLQSQLGEMFINFWICRCGIVYADRHPVDEEEVDKYYNEFYTPLTEGHWGVDGLKKREAERAARLITKNLLFPEVLRYLDIGCCYGGLLDAVSEKYGCVSEGCDIRDFADGYKVHKSLDEIEETYDLVTCIHTLEHVTDPVGYLKAIRKVCSGTLFMEVPSFSTSKGVLSPHHLFGFTTHTLHDIVENAGFRVIEVGQAVHGPDDEHNKVELQVLAEVGDE